MSCYKRLTNNNRDEYDPEYDFCCDCKYFDEPCGCNKSDGTCDNYDRFLETYNRLAELEDKIENGTLTSCYYVNGFESIIDGKETTDNLPLEVDTINLPKYSARISIGNFQINLTDKTFTEEQIENMKEMLGWEVENL